MLFSFTRKNVLTSFVVILFLATFLMTSCSKHNKEEIVIPQSTPAPTTVPQALPPTFIGVDRVQELMIAQSSDGMEGIKDKDGWVVAPEYITVRDFSEGLAGVAISHDTEADLLKQQGLDDKAIKNALLEKGIHKTLIYNMIDNARDKKYADLWGFVDIYGNIMVIPQYQSVGRFKNGLALVKEYGKKWEKGLYHFIDKAGAKAIELPWSDFVVADEFQEDGTAVVKRKCGYGVINTNGDVIIPFIYSELARSIDGYRPARPQLVEYANLWGIINSEGNWIVEPKFSSMSYTKDGHLLVEYSDEEVSGNGIINILGEWKVHPREKRIRESDCDLLIYVEREAGEFQVPIESLYNYSGTRLLGDNQYQSIEIVTKDIMKCARYNVEEGEEGAHYQFVRTDGKVLIDGLSQRHVGFLGELVKSNIGELQDKKVEYNYIDNVGIKGKIELGKSSMLQEIIDNIGLEYFKVAEPMKARKGESISVYEGDVCRLSITNEEYYILINFDGANGVEQYISQKPRGIDIFELMKTAFQ